MLHRLTSRINSAHVIATIALFVALGGGYAFAFSGSGSLQKAGEVGITGSAGGTAVDEVRTLTGIGAIGATCDTSAAGNMTIQLRNNTGIFLSVDVQSFDGGNGAREVPAGNEYDDIYSAAVNNDSLDMHVTQGDGTKAPQALIRIRVLETGDCATSRVQVLALNTQQP